MKTKKWKPFVFLLSSVFVFTACVDDKYDLSNIDTTTAVKLNNLTVPVNLDKIELDQVLKVDEDDPDNQIKIYTDGQGNKYYAIEVDGSFTADPVNIPVFEAITSEGFTVKPLMIPVNGPVIEDETTTFSYLIKDVDPSLMTISKFYMQTGKELELNLTVTPSTAELTNVILQLPENYVAAYKNKTYTTDVPVNISNGSLDAPVYIIEMVFDPSKPVVDGVLDIDGEIGFKTATVSNANMITVDFMMSSFTADKVSGTVKRYVDAPAFEPVYLNNIPDFLTQGETNLILKNPQLYLDFKSLYGAYYNTTINIMPQGEDTRDINIDLDPFQTAIVIAPDTKNLGLPSLLENPVTQDDTQLMYILSGKGLPTSIDFGIVDTYLDGEVTDLPLGQDQTINGTYTFFSPLSLENGSQIIYTKEENDFFGDDLSEVNITELQISADVSTNLPFEIQLYVYPLDKFGNVLDSAYDVVSKNAVNEKLDIHFTKPFKGLDGVRFDVITNDMDGTTLMPSQYVNLTEIRARITGEYIAIDKKYKDDYPEY